jgi:hypothetical protein
MIPTDNPYAAPESILTFPLSEATAGIRAVSKGFRVVGWIGVALFAFYTMAWAMLFIYAAFIAEYTPSAEALWEVAQNTVGAGVVLFVSWIIVRAGRNLLTASRRAYRVAIALSCLMVIAFPLAPLGIYCLIKLRKHWPDYCQEQAAMAASP